MAGLGCERLLWLLAAPADEEFRMRKAMRSAVSGAVVLGLLGFRRQEDPAGS